MRLRIPSPINAAIDAFAQHRLLFTGVVGAAIWTVVVLSQSAVFGAAAAAGTAGGAVLAVLGLQARRLRDRAEQAEYNERATRAELAALSVGDPSAPTVQLRTIGEAGEPT